VSEDEESGPSRESTGATSWAATEYQLGQRCKRPGRRCRRPRSRRPRPRRWRERRRIENGFSQLGLPISPPVRGEVREWRLHGCSGGEPAAALRRGRDWMIALLIAAAVAQPGRDPTLPAPRAEPIVAPGSRSRSYAPAHAGAGGSFRGTGEWWRGLPACSARAPCPEHPRPGRGRRGRRDRAARGPPRGRRCPRRSESRGTESF